MKKLLLSLLIFSLSFSSLAEEKKGSYSNLAKNLDIFNTVFREVYVRYVDEVDGEELINVALREMLQELDPFTSFFPEKNADEILVQSTGYYGGIGVTLYKQKGKVFVFEVYESTPAHKKGILVGDIILEIDGHKLDNLDFEEVVEKMKREVGKVVLLKIHRVSENRTFNLEIEREEIKIKNVTFSKLFGNVGYIKLSGFTKNASQEVKKSYVRLQNEGNVEALVLDLRENPGGLLNEAVKISNLFLEKGKEIVTVKGRYKENIQKQYTEEIPVNAKIPLVILVNSSSASASEIVAGSLQDYDRALILGEETYGKGLVQNTIELDYNTQLKITIAKYYIPSGRCIQAYNYGNGNQSFVHTDSLKKEFKTLNGRPVFSGKGIFPDTLVESQTASPILSFLVENLHFFEFLNQGNRQYGEVKDASTFELPEKVVDDFFAYLKKNNVEYKTKTQQYLEKIEETAKEDSLFQYVKSGLNEIKANAAGFFQKKFYEDAKQIKGVLESGYVFRQLMRKGVIEYNLRDDKQLETAIEILRDKNAYDSFFYIKPKNEN